eukprot:5994822-Pyramimonas_sp.AAC.1
MQLNALAPLRKLLQARPSIPQDVPEYGEAEIGFRAPGVKARWPDDGHPNDAFGEPDCGFS